jgi:hypothetical protein
MSIVPGDDPYDVTKDFDKVLVNGLALWAYIVHCPSEAEPETNSVLVYAQSEVMACEIGCVELGGDAEACEAHRRPENDMRAQSFLAGRVERDPEYLRTAGWRMEGEWACGCCGLAAFGMKKYAVCRMTSQCKDCGCDDADNTEPPCDHEDGFSCE